MIWGQTNEKNIKRNWVGLIYVTERRGVCKTWTGHLRMADADGKMRIEKNADGKNAENKQSKRKQTRNTDGKKNKIIIK